MLIIITSKQLRKLEIKDVIEVLKDLKADDLSELVGYLSDSDEKVRYHAFLILQSYSQYSNEVYQFLETFNKLLNSENIYQRSMGLMMIAENAKWDEDNKLELVIDEYLEHVYDSRPIAERQCIHSLRKIIPYKPNLRLKIAEKLISFDITCVTETMRELVYKDILAVLMDIRKYETTPEIEAYVERAAAEGIIKI